MSLDKEVKLIDVVNSVGTLDSNYLPHGTVIRVELDGTGDFNNLPDAIDFINHKYSNGIVTIQLGEGTFVLDNLIMLGNDLYQFFYVFNFTELMIKGKGTNKTTLSFECDVYADFQVFGFGYNVSFDNLTITQPNTNVVNGMNSNIAISALHGSKINIGNVNFNNVGMAIASSYESIALISRNVNITTACYGFFAYCGSITCLWGRTVNASNIKGSLVECRVGGIFRESAWTLTTSNVNKLYNLSTNTAASSGGIYISP